ncbi:FAD-dependent oxidoreductase [Pelagivirga sediminicola]|uniref:FAD-dependent oxidoreductase n=1 Tax=Pelagivirga sediminicola TaxID=2170575 RepID=A0A2T7G8R1_9RHOB|nr:FAD-dependent oxidoreductase [Pelagivirga sediminicola]PVA10803.1 FAD-dependent oxidoreductase [Pelagivirga sediminicola]
MMRIYPPHAYGEAPRANCYWPTTVDAEANPPARGTLTADVAIIGAGFTGLSAALHLAQDGADVIVLEAHDVGWGASGRNGGFCCLGGSAASDKALARQFGEDARREFRMTEPQAVKLAEDLITRHDMQVDRHSDGETVMAHTPAAYAGFDKRAQDIERDYGVTPTLTPKDALAQNGMSGSFHGALTTPIGFSLNPMKYVQGLATAARAAGVRISGRSPVQRIEQGRSFTLTTAEARIQARRLIVATNGYSSDDLPDWMKGRYLPTQSNVLVTRPMTGDELAAQGWTTRQACFDDRFFLHYFRLMPDNRMLFGMRDGLFSAPWADARMDHNIRQHFDTMFPAWRDVDAPHRWHGLLSLARDLTPYVGPIDTMPGAFTALSYHGNGVAMATYAGALLADLAQDRTPGNTYPRIMQSPPKRWPLGRFRRAWFWPVYAAMWATGA